MSSWLFHYFRTAALFAVLVWPVTSSLAFDQQPPAPSAQQSDQRANEVATKMVSTSRLFLKGRSSDPGITVDLREDSRAQVQGHLTVRYRLYVHGAPAAQTYSLLSWPINANEPSTVLEGVSVGKDGLVICAGKAPSQCGSPDKPDDPVNLAFAAARAEPVRLALVSEDKKLTMMFGTVPDPLATTDRGCVIEAIRLMPRWEVVLVRAKGFKPNEAVQFASKSGVEGRAVAAKADANGEYMTALLPFVDGKQSGTTKVQISSASCAPAVSFEWGKI
jgi:hypothetical protein